MMEFDVPLPALSTGTCHKCWPMKSQKPSPEISAKTAWGLGCADRLRINSELKWRWTPCCLRPNALKAAEIKVTKAFNAIKNMHLLIHIQLFPSSPLTERVQKEVWKFLIKFYAYVIYSFPSKPCERKTMSRTSLTRYYIKKCQLNWEFLFRNTWQAS